MNWEYVIVDVFIKAQHVLSRSKLAKNLILFQVKEYHAKSVRAIRMRFI